MNLNSISQIDKELGAGGIQRKQEQDFYISNSGNDQNIGYLQEKSKISK